jgi:DNA-binding CsgD family transcriptional regulator
MITTGIALPQAFFTKSKEYFKKDDVRYVLTEGMATVLDEFPADYYLLLKEALTTDKNVEKGLSKLGITVESEQVYKFWDCNYSSFDHTCDVMRCGNLGNREFVECDKRESCSAEGLLCTIPNGLSIRQAQVAKRIALGQMDAQICAELGIKQPTLTNHKNNIETKIGSTGKIAIGVWAVKNKLV